MTEFWIQAVRYTSYGPIEAVLAAPYNAATNSFVTAPQTLPLAFVVNHLKVRAARFFTSLHEPSGWRRGAEVGLAADNRFITSAPNGWVYDNLESLPRF